MNVTENKNEATETTATTTAAKKKLPLWGKILLVVVIVLAALAGLATLYVILSFVPRQRMKSLLPGVRVIVFSLSCYF